MMEISHLLRSQNNVLQNDLPLSFYLPIIAVSHKLYRSNTRDISAPYLRSFTFRYFDNGSPSSFSRPSTLLKQLQRYRVLHTHFSSPIESLKSDHEHTMNLHTLYCT